MKFEVERVRYVPPRNDVERVITEIWQNVLGVQRIGIHDNFFDLGGHSLLMLQVHHKLRERFATIIGGPPQLRDRDASTCRTLMLLPAALSPRARKTLPTPDSHDFSGTGYAAVRPFNIR